MVNTPLGRTQNPELATTAEVVYVPYREPEPVWLRVLHRRGCNLRCVPPSKPTRLEDGISHPAEEIIGQALQSGECPDVLAWLRALCLNTAQPSFAASVLRCLGRQSDPGTDKWRAGLVRAALATDDVEIRDGAVQAAESVGGLESHRRSQRPFGAGDMASILYPRRH